MRQEKGMGRLRGKKRMAVILMAGMIGIGGYCSAGAKTLEDAQNKKNEAEKNLNEVNRQIEGIEKEQNGLKAEMQAYDNQLMTLLTDMELLQADMENKDAEIDQAEASLEAAKQEERSQYEAMKLRIQYLYESGNTGYMELLLTSDSVADLITEIRIL